MDDNNLPRQASSVKALGNDIVTTTSSKQSGQTQHIDKSRRAVEELEKKLGTGFLSGISERLNELGSEPPSQKSKKAKNAPRASREDYFNLIRDTLGEMPRDMFTECCFLRDRDAWRPAENYLDLVKTAANNLAVSGELSFAQELIRSYFFEIQHNTTPKLIAEIPEWDGVSRIETLAQCLLIDGDQQPAYSMDVVRALLTHWLVGVFRKLRDPMYQNPVLVLYGKQGLGKEFFINALVGGFEQWAKNIHIGRDDKDNYLQLSSCAVLKIPEFDKYSSKHDVSSLKDMIFRESTYIRESYAAQATDRNCTASMIGSSNTEDFFHDHTGSRRFMVINLVGIERKYPHDAASQKQLLAEASYLDSIGWVVPDKCLALVAESGKRKTPTSPQEFVVNQFAACVEAAFAEGGAVWAFNVKKRGHLTHPEMEQYKIRERLVSATRIKWQKILEYLGAAGLANRTSTYRFLKIPPVIIDPEGCDNSAVTDLQNTRDSTTASDGSVTATQSHLNLIKRDIYQ